MKKNLLFKSLFALALVLISGNAWADKTITITPDATDSKATTYEQTAQTFTVGGVEFVMNNFNPSTGQIRGNKDAVTQNFYLYNTTPFDDELISVSIDGATLANDKTFIQTGDAAITEPTATGTNANSSSWSNLSGKYFCISFARGATSGTVKMTSVTITYKGESTGDPVAVTDVQLNQSELSLEVGGTATLTATVLPADATNKAITWSSSNTAVATVDNGKVTAVAKGESTITVTTTDGGKTATCKVTVTEAQTLTTIEAIQAAAIAAGTTPKDVTITFGGWVVTGIKSNNNVYVSDGDKGFVIYDKETKYEKGDVLSGTVACKVQYYSNNTYELTNLPSTAEGLVITKGGSVEPKVKTIAELSLANQGSVVTIKGVTYTASGAKFTDGTNTIVFYDVFNAKPTLNDGGVYDVTGVIIPYSSLEIAPLSADDVVAKTSQVAPTSAWENSSVTVNLGGSVDNEFTTDSDGDITYSSSKTTVATISANGTVTIVGEGTTTITAETTETDTYYSSKASYQLTVIDPNSTKKVDVLNYAFTELSNQGYGDWNDKVGVSGAVYYGNSYNNANNDLGVIQLKSDESISGIITTTSAGIVTNINVKWNSKTTAGRTIDVYGCNIPFTCPGDLYSNSTQAVAGVKIGSIVYGEDNSTELVVDKYYPYIGVRSNKGALYLDEIAFTWETKYCGGITIGETGYATYSSYFNSLLPEGVQAFAVTAVGTDAVTLTEVQEIAAGEGYILKGTPGETYFFTEVPATLGTINAPEGNLLSAAIGSVKIGTEGKDYILAADETGEAKFFKSETGTLAAGKAYLHVDGTASTVLRLGGTTGIRFVEEESNNVVYDMLGRIVKNPVKGIYIVNGKKMMIK